MTLTEEQVRAEAQILDEAERTRTQARQTTSIHPDMTMCDAYRVQAAWLDIKTARGEAVVGHNVWIAIQHFSAKCR